ncbi:hypothetical protein Pint_11392 [Pistacia integerrima]|uniref:Uncharacterized protein n=1 Tax=Pistacia integerrima TaxID=434235 RepID=A0ACC0XIC1_9ROSI|nr:hypothetical protein Pint_11392 [Pistacia integerrima]
MSSKDFEDAGHKLDPGQEMEICYALLWRVMGRGSRIPEWKTCMNPFSSKDNPKNTLFCINFFTSIGLGGVPINLREYLKKMPWLIMQQQNLLQNQNQSHQVQKLNGTEGKEGEGVGSEGEETKYTFSCSCN